MGPERSGRWPGSWGCTGERCGRRWPARCRRSGRYRNGSGRNWRRRSHSSTRFWRPTARRPESSGTRRTGSGCDCAARSRKSRWRSRRFVSMCAPGRLPWACWGTRPSCRSPTSSVARRRWIGMKAGRSSTARPRKTYVFCMRSMASGGAFHRAYPHANQQAFLEAHELAFAYFGGVFRVLRYDNLKSAVKKILRGHQREETARFIAFRSHWGFAVGVLHAGRGTREGWRGRRRGPVPAEPSGARAERAAPGGAEPAAGGGIARGAEPGDRRAARRRSARG